MFGMRVTADSPPRLSRRGLLRATAGLAFTTIGMPLLAACSPAAPSGGSGTGPSSSARVKLPTYAPLPNLPKPDLDGSPDGLVEPGYLKYPVNLIKSVPQPP